MTERKHVTRTVGRRDADLVVHATASEAHVHARKHKILRENWYRDLWLFVISAFLLIGFLSDRAERVLRTSQTCLIFERGENEAYSRLTGTYEYLGGLSLRSASERLNATIIARLPELESDVMAKQAPPYCDETAKTGILWWSEDVVLGLPEPVHGDPLPPKRPAAVDLLIDRLSASG